MPIFIFIRGDAMDVVDQVKKNADTIQNTADKINSFIGKVKGSWIGGDEQNFEREVLTRVIPATLDYMAALAGMNSNTLQAMEIMDAADSAARGIASQIQDAFSGI